MDEGRLEDTRLIERACAGDVDAYGELVRRYQDLAIRAAYLILGDAAEAEDAVQDAFVKVYDALPRFHADAPFRPWVLRIVVNEAHDRRRAEGRRVALVARVALGRAEQGDTPESIALATERRVMLLRALDELRDEERLVVTCRYFLALSEAESAEVLGCARGTVKSRLSRALRRLRDRLSGTASDDPVTMVGWRRRRRG